MSEARPGLPGPGPHGPIDGAREQLTATIMTTPGPPRPLWAYASNGRSATFRRKCPGSVGRRTSCRLESGAFRQVSKGRGCRREGHVPAHCSIGLTGVRLGARSSVCNKWAPHVARLVRLPASSHRAGVSARSNRGVRAAAPGLPPSRHWCHWRRGGGAAGVVAGKDRTTRLACPALDEDAASGGHPAGRLARSNSGTDQ